MLLSKLINLPPFYKKKSLSTSCILFLCSAISREHAIISLAFCVYCSFNYSFVILSAVILTDSGFTTHTSRNQTSSKTALFFQLISYTQHWSSGKNTEIGVRRQEVFSQPSHIFLFSPQASHLTSLYIAYWFENVSNNVKLLNWTNTVKKSIL